MNPGSLQGLTDALEYWGLVTKHRWPVLLATLGLTLVFTLVLAGLPNVYEATTTILVDPQQVPEKYVTPVVSSDPYARLNTITQQVLSRTRLQQIIDKLNLYAELRASLSPEELIERMRQDITIQVKQGSGPELSTFTITYQGRSPQTVAQVANELAASFIQWNVNSREQQVTGTKEFLSSELQEAKQSLEQQEDKLRQFKMSHLGETPDQTPNNLQALANLRTALQANSDSLNRLEQEKVLMTRLPESIPLAGAPTVDLSERGRLEMERRELQSTLEGLRLHYSDRYPDVVRATKRLAEVNAQLAALPPDKVDSSPMPSKDESAASVRLELNDKEMKRLKAEQNRLQSQVSAYQAKVDAAPLREQQLVELTRNYDISKQHYQALLDKSFTISMAADLEQKQKGERFTVLDPAQVPQKPVKPERKRLMVLAFVAAMGFSIVGVLAKETLSPAIKTEVELKNLIPAGVQIVGLIPRIQTAADTRRSRRMAVLASFTCIAICLALAGVIWKMRAVL